MKEKELDIDLNCHAVYSRKCKEEILKRIAEHYDISEQNKIFEDIQHQYEYFLKEFKRKDLGGKRNFHNRKSGTYDCIMILCYYVISKDKTSFSEIEEMATAVTVGDKKLNFIDIDKPLYKKLMYSVMKNAEKKCVKWKDYDMHVDPYSKEKPIHYTFTSCPFADFVHQFHLEEIAGALCNVDYPAMEQMNTKLVRMHTCIESDHCDYTFYSKNNPELKEHPEYMDENGFIRNR